MKTETHATGSLFYLFDNFGLFSHSIFTLWRDPFILPSPPLLKSILWNPLKIVCTAPINAGTDLDLLPLNGFFVLGKRKVTQCQIRAVWRIWVMSLKIVCTAPINAGTDLDFLPFKCFFVSGKRKVTQCQISALWGMWHNCNNSFHQKFDNMCGYFHFPHFNCRSFYEICTFIKWFKPCS